MTEAIKKVSKSGWSLRPGTPDDLEQLASIESQVHIAPWSRTHFQEELEKPYSHLWVYTDNETDAEIAGYVCFWTLFEELSLLNVVVAQSYRRFGFAKEMLQKMIQLGIQKNLKRIVLDVRKSNESAIALYQSQGFAIRHVQKNFYSNGEDAYQMEKRLDGDPHADLL